MHFFLHFQEGGDIMRFVFNQEKNDAMREILMMRPTTEEAKAALDRNGTELGDLRGRLHLDLPPVQRGKIPQRQGVYLRRIWTTSPDGNNNNNYGWYSNATVDKLLADAAVEMDEAKRLDLYKQAQQILYIDDPAAIWTNDRLTVWALSSKVEGFVTNVNNSIFFYDLKCAE